MDEQYWRLKRTYVGQNKSDEQWGLTWEWIEKHIEGSATCGMFIVTPIEAAPGCFRWTSQSISTPSWMCIIDVTPDTEYQPDLLGAFFGGRTVDTLTGGDK